MRNFANIREYQANIREINGNCLPRVALANGGIFFVLILLKIGNWKLEIIKV